MELGLGSSSANIVPSALFHDGCTSKVCFVGSNFFFCWRESWTISFHALSGGASWPKSSVHSGNLRKIFVFLQPGSGSLALCGGGFRCAGKVLFIDAIGVVLEGWTGREWSRKRCLSFFFVSVIFSAGFWEEIFTSSVLIGFFELSRPSWNDYCSNRAWSRKEFHFNRVFSLGAHSLGHYLTGWNRRLRLVEWSYPKGWS